MIYVVNIYFILCSQRTKIILELLVLKKFIKFTRLASMGKKEITKLLIDKIFIEFSNSFPNDSIFALILPCNHRKSKIRISWNIFVRQRERIRRRFRKKICRWPAGSKSLFPNSEESPSSWSSPRNCRRHWKVFKLFSWKLISFLF